MAKIQEDRNLLPVEEVAEELETTPLSVLMRIKRKLIEGREIDGKWYVTGESLAAYLEKGGTPEDQPLCSAKCPGKSDGCSCG